MWLVSRLCIYKLVANVAPTSEYGPIYAFTLFMSKWRNAKTYWNPIFFVVPSVQSRYGCRVAAMWGDNSTQDVA